MCSDLFRATPRRDHRRGSSSFESQTPTGVGRHIADHPVEDLSDATDPGADARQVGLDAPINRNDLPSQNQAHRDYRSGAAIARSATDVVGARLLGHLEGVLPVLTGFALGSDLQTWFTGVRTRRTAEQGVVGDATSPGRRLTTSFGVENTGLAERRSSGLDDTLVFQFLFTHRDRVVLRWNVHLDATVLQVEDRLETLGPDAVGQCLEVLVRPPLERLLLL